MTGQRAGRCLRQRATEIQCQGAALRGEDVALDEAVQRRCRDTVTDLGSGIRVARLMFDATVRRMRSRSGHPARISDSAQKVDDEKNDQKCSKNAAADIHMHLR